MSLTFDFLTSKFDRFMPLSRGPLVALLASNRFSRFSKYRFHKFGNRQTKERTNERTDRRTGRKHNASGESGVQTRWRHYVTLDWRRHKNGLKNKPMSMASIRFGKHRYSYHIFSHLLKTIVTKLYAKCQQLLNNVTYRTEVCGLRGQRKTYQSCWQRCRL